MSTLICHSFCRPRCSSSLIIQTQIYNQLFIMRIFKDILVQQNEVCYHGNQCAAALMSCKNTEDNVLAYDQIHLDYIVILN